MTLKPTGLAAETESERDLEDLSDELRVDASDDVTVEAAEDVTMESPTRTHEAPQETPAPTTSFVSAVSGDIGDIADPGPTPLPTSILGVLSPSLPLPGVTAASSSVEDLLADRSVDEEDVTTLARSGEDDLTRPAVTDDDEEETKVEHAETALHAAASRDDVGAALLSEQASVEREKALRKSAPGLFGGSTNGTDSGVEFADPETDDDDEVISAGPVVDEDDDGIVVGGHNRDRHPVDDSEDDSTAMFGKPADPSPLVAALTARRPGSPPTGTPFRADGFGSARLPTPSPGFAGLSLSSPAALPAPASSPFGKLASVPAPYGAGTRTTTASIPALQIPAPSGAAATPSEGTGLLRRITLPIGGLLPVGLACVLAGVVIGWVARGGSPAPAPVAMAAPRVVAPSVPAPVVQPVPAPEPAAPTNAGAAPSALPAATGTPGAPEPVAVKPTPAAQPEAVEAPPAPAHPVAKRVAPKPRKVALDGADEPPAPRAAAPKPAPAPAAKPAKPAAKGKSKVWVDPFAE